MKRIAMILVASVLVLTMSAGAQAATQYRKMSVYPYTGSQEEACRLVGLSPCSPRPIEQVCPRRYVENGSYLWAMTDTVHGKHKVGHDFEMALDPRDPKTNHWAYVCNPFTDGWTIFKFEGCNNYVYTPYNRLVLSGETAPVAYQPPQEQPQYSQPAPVYSGMVQPAYYSYPAANYAPAVYQQPTYPSVNVSVGAPTASSSSYSISSAYSNTSVFNTVAPHRNPHFPTPNPPICHNCQALAQPHAFVRPPVPNAPPPAPPGAHLNGNPYGVLMPTPVNPGGIRSVAPPPVVPFNQGTVRSGDVIRSPTAFPAPIPPPVRSVAPPPVVPFNQGTVRSGTTIRSPTSMPAQAAAPAPASSMRSAAPPAVVRFGSPGTVGGR